MAGRGKWRLAIASISRIIDEQDDNAKIEPKARSNWVQVNSSPNRKTR